MASFLQKIGNFRRVIKTNGGIVSSIQNYYWIDSLKERYLVGEDKFGNKYFQNDNYFLGKNRHVHYNVHVVGYDEDGSSVPAEWHRWLHHMTDHPPTEVPPKHRSWLAEHTANRSGTSGEYIPYSTTKPKIESWSPPTA